MRHGRPTGHVLDGQDPSLAYGKTSAAGPPLVLLHGLGARWQVFQPLMMRLDKQFQQYAPDLRGHGMSARTPGHYGIRDFVSDTVRFIETMTEPPVSLYGHSLGGWIGLMTAAQRPDLISALIIADSAIYPADLDPQLVVSYLADVPVALRSLAKSLDQLDPEVMTHFRDGRMLANYAPDKLLSEVACPTLLIQGDESQGALMSDADVKRAMYLLRDARHVRLEGLGHALHVEDTEVVAAEVLSFLKPLPVLKTDPHGHYSS
jgi:pimeloyl-ACP methyl ester carboxylesterase